MGDYTGKRFEDDFRKSAQQCSDISCDRLYDNVGGYAGVRNICDFIVSRYPHIYYFELKAHKGNTLPFSAVTDFQWAGLLDKAMSVRGAFAGVLIHFTDHEVNYFVDIRVLEALRQQGQKSIHVEQAEKYGVLFDGRRKRVSWEYYFLDRFFMRVNKSEPNILKAVEELCEGDGNG